MEPNSQENSNQHSSLPQPNINNQQEIPKSKNRKGIKILIVAFLSIVLIPLLYIAIKLALTGVIIYKNLSKLPKSSPQTSFTNLPTSSDNRLEQSRKQARNEARKLDIDIIAKGLELNYGKLEPNKYPPLQDELFAGRKIPKDPLGKDYLGIPKESVSSFEICANLENATPNQYCVKSKQPL